MTHEEWAKSGRTRFLMEQTANALTFYLENGPVVLRSRSGIIYTARLQEAFDFIRSARYGLNASTSGGREHATTSQRKDRELIADFMTAHEKEWGPAKADTIAKLLGDLAIPLRQLTSARPMKRPKAQQVRYAIKFFEQLSKQLAQQPTTKEDV